ncbi:hypothetical protein LIER_17682 [Lithospermum erythrorhizon]|uniref:Reverse transcriptase RNase H-like domain-containing protein n=1 Tax=Lithospermum erythrorhizon TaxID=34254 RepID=A0AAV3QEH1_LITER
MKPPNSYGEMSKEEFVWEEEKNRAFEDLKEYSGSPQLLSRAEEGETLQIYLAISDVVVSNVLIREAEGVQRLIYYVSHVLHEAEERYPIIDKAALALILSKRKVKAYFESHPIQVFTDQPLKRVLTSLALSERLTTWAVELSKFEITCHPRTSKSSGIGRFHGRVHRSSYSFPPKFETRKGE